MPAKGRDAGRSWKNAFGGIEARRESTSVFQRRERVLTQSCRNPKSRNYLFTFHPPILAANRREIIEKTQIFVELRRVNDLTARGFDRRLSPSVQRLRSRLASPGAAVAVACGESRRKRGKQAESRRITGPLVFPSLLPASRATLHY